VSAADLVLSILVPAQATAAAERVAGAIAETAPGVSGATQLLTRAAAGARLPERPAAGHKGTFGHVLVVAGSEGKTGAASLAAEGAARAGAGLVSIACPAGLNDILEIKCTEAMTVPVPDTSDRSFAARAASVLTELAAERSAVALGPGIGRGAETLKLVRDVVPLITKPLVIDADGLFAFAGEPERLAERRGATVLTPHPGEAGSLLNAKPAEINRDRVAAARALAERSAAVVLLKGAATVVAAPDGQILVNPTGGPALGSGGTGDVLTGVVAGLLAQGCSAFDAAALAAFVHGAAADRMAAAAGPSGLLAGELARALPGEFESLRRRASEAAEEPAAEWGLAVSFPEP